MVQVYSTTHYCHTWELKTEMDSISNKAFAYGYLGGGLLLVAHLGMVIVTDYANWAMPFAMATSGIWWLGFAMLTFKMMPRTSYRK